MRTITMQIRAGEVYCCWCHCNHANTCMAFLTKKGQARVLKPDGNGAAMRCAQCIEAERQAGK
jgi:hypothetical protein